MHLLSKLHEYKSPSHSLFLRESNPTQLVIPVVKKKIDSQTNNINKNKFKVIRNKIKNIFLKKAENNVMTSGLGRLSWTGQIS